MGCIELRGGPAFVKHTVSSDALQCRRHGFRQTTALHLLHKNDVCVRRRVQKRINTVKWSIEERNVGFPTLPLTRPSFAWDDDVLGGTHRILDTPVITVSVGISGEVRVRGVIPAGTGPVGSEKRR